MLDAVVPPPPTTGNPSKLVMLRPIPICISQYHAVMPVAVVPVDIIPVAIIG